MKTKSAWALCAAAIAVHGAAAASVQEPQKTESQPPEIVETVPTLPVDPIKAQRADEPESLGSAPTRLEEIVATASKQKESARALAASVTALTATNEPRNATLRLTFELHQTWDVS